MLEGNANNIKNLRTRSGAFFIYGIIANKKGGVMLNLLSQPAIEIFLPIAKWLAIGVLIASILSCIAVFLNKKEYAQKIIKIVLFILFIFFTVLGITCLIMKIISEYSDAEMILSVRYILIPLTVFLCIILISAIVTAVLAKLSSPENIRKTLKKCLLVFGLINLFALVVCGILLAVYYEQIKSYYTANSPVLYASAGLLIVTVLVLGFILNKHDKPFDTRCISTAGICVAMSFGLSYITLWKMPQGGSITLVSLLPIMIFSFIYGTKKGILVCFIYGILQAVQDPWLIHPAQFLLDYPVAFMCIGLSGAFSKLKAFEKTPQIAFLLGGIVGSCFRFLSHLLSGVFAFSSYAGEVNPWIYSSAYNSFVFIDIALVLVSGVIIFSSKAFVKELNKSK